MISSRHLSHALLICGLLVLTGCNSLPEPPGAPHVIAPPALIGFAPISLTGVTAMTLGGGHSCAAVLANGMRCWGDGQSGQLGNASNSNSSAPVEPTSWGSGPTGVGGGVWILGFAAGDSHTCAINSSGKLFCWGSNSFGQLGLSSTTDYNLSQPVREFIPAVPVSQVVAGENHTCALYSGGLVACWGRFYDKQPQVIVGLTNPFQIAAGGNRACAVEAGGAVQCWRMMVSNQQPTPALVPAVIAKKIAVGRTHACAIDQSDVVQCWGTNNTQGQLGNGTRGPVTGAVSTVIRSGVFVAAVEIAAGGDHTCALLSSGAVECWGQNDYGQTGDPSLTGFTLTARPVIASGASGIASGSDHSCARMAGAGNTQTMLCWGGNWRGQLGNPSAGPFSVTPVAVLR